LPLWETICGFQVEKALTVPDCVEGIRKRRGGLRAHRHSRFLGLDDRIAVFLGIAVAIPWNFGINLLTTWRKPVSVIGERRIL